MPARSHGGLALRLAGRGLLRRGMRTIPTAVALLAITFTAAATALGLVKFDFKALQDLIKQFA